MPNHTEQNRTSKPVAANRRTFVTDNVTRVGLAVFGLSLAQNRLLAADRSLLSKEVAKPTQKSATRKLSVETLTRVKSVLEARGEVRLHGGSDPKDKIRRASLQSKTTLQYQERLTKAAAPEDFAMSAIYFQTANVQSTVETHATDNNLRPDSVTMIRWCEPSQARCSTAGVDQTLTEKERKIADSPIVTLYLEYLVPESRLVIGEKFQLTNLQAAKLLNVDAITAGELSVTLVDQDDTLQQLEIIGKLSAAVNAVPTTLEINGKIRVELATQLVSYFAANIKEEREIGLAEPGFQVDARIRLIRETIDESESLKPLQEYNGVLEQRQTQALQQFDSAEGGYRFLADQDWVTYKDSEVEALLRLVKRNRSLAQCNIVNLSDMEPGRQLTIDGFKSDIRRSLGKSFGNVLEETERLTENKLRLMRVVATGQVEGIRLQWINLLISNDEGRHVSVVFTFNAEHVGELNGGDMQFADSFEFTRKLKSNETEADAKKEVADSGRAAEKR